eukprot:TRINITY_DN59772_c0_g1_i1.p1 TRINITY_DN59772_c0_g1~~TRINITY_DN59772_c0_g1_i1.p1  ORF type:complete len:358 (+),score=23.88 TRINITY_DN59772_c0_g1_i1:20-1093(+)
MAALGECLASVEALDRSVHTEEELQSDAINQCTPSRVKKRRKKVVKKKKRNAAAGLRFVDIPLDVIEVIVHFIQKPELSWTCSHFHTHLAMWYLKYPGFLPYSTYEKRFDKIAQLRALKLNLNWTKEPRLNCSTVRTLSLRVVGQYLPELVEGMELANMRSLEVLTLANGPDGFNSKGIPLLANYLAAQENLQQVSLALGGACKVQDADFVHLGCLGNSSSLRQLSLKLSENNISNNGLEGFVQNLSRSHTLCMLTIELDHCKLDQNAGAALGCLIGIPHLVFGLSGNRLGDVGLEALVGGLAKSGYLTSVEMNLACCGLTNVNCLQKLHHISSLKTMRAILFGNSSGPPKLFWARP